MKEFKSTPDSFGSVKDVDPDRRTVTGYYASITTFDADEERFAKSAFDETIERWGPGGRNRIWHLDQHMSTRRVTKPDVLLVDDTGLYFESTLPNTPLAKGRGAPRGRHDDHHEGRAVRGVERNVGREHEHAHHRR